MLVVNIIFIKANYALFYMTLSASEFFGKSVDALKVLIMAIGAGLGIYGIVNLLEGYGNDNPGARSQGIKQFLAGGGIILLGSQVVPLLRNLFNF